MKAPISEKARKLLNNKNDAKKLMEAMLNGERSGNKSFKASDGKTYRLKRAFSYSEK